MLHTEILKIVIIDIVIESQRPRPSGRGLKKGNDSLAASIPTLPGWALKGGGKITIKGLYDRI